MSKRTTIRENIEKILKSAQTRAGENVFRSRVSPLWKSQLPAILIYGRDEQSALYEVGSNVLERKFRVAIQAEAEGESLDDQLDQIASEIEDAMKKDSTLCEAANESLLIQTEIEVSTEGEKPYGAIRLTYEVTYYS